MNASNVSQNEWREEHCTGMHSTGLTNQNGEHLLNLCESKILETYGIFLADFIVIYPELYFLLERVEKIKIKIAYRRVTGDEFIWKRISFIHSC